MIFHKALCKDFDKINLKKDLLNKDTKFYRYYELAYHDTTHGISISSLNRHRGRLNWDMFNLEYYYTMDLLDETYQPNDCDNHSIEDYIKENF